MAHITLRVSSLTASVDFYDALLPRLPRPSIGFSGAWYTLLMLTEPADSDAREHAAELHLIEDRGMTAGGPSSRTYRRSGAHGMHAAMRVRCLGCARASLARLGVQVALSVPRPDNMTQLYFGPDPDGFWWELLAESERAPEGLLSDPLGTWPLLPRRRKLAGLPPSSGPSSSRGTGGAVASGNPLVSAAVESVLKAGGSAADGAVAAAAVLGVVEPCAAAHTHAPCTAAGARHAALPDSPRLVPPPPPPPNTHTRTVTTAASVATPTPSSPTRWQACSAPRPSRPSWRAAACRAPRQQPLVSASSCARWGSPTCRRPAHSAC